MRGVQGSGDDGLTRLSGCGVASERGSDGLIALAAKGAPSWYVKVQTFGRSAGVLFHLGLP